jgi:hypothetical protein
MTQTVHGYPATSARCRGWLRYLYRKATTPDNWDKDGRPHAHWDGISGEPTASWHRMDLSHSSYAMVRDGAHTFTWTHTAIAEHLTTQWARRPAGVHCENTKIWPH